MKKYELTNEHREQLSPWSDKWIKTIMSTDSMSKDEKNGCIEAVEGLYKAANLNPPPRERIIFVRSPFVGVFASGFASAIWHIRENNDMNSQAYTLDATEAATWDATEDATRDATEAATRYATRNITRAETEYVTEAATRAATEDATRDATEAATWAATRAATEDATLDATRDATWDATRDATEDATLDATRDATLDATRDATNKNVDDNKWYKFDISSMIDLSNKLGLGDFGLNCANKSYYRFFNGGNMWGQSVSFYSFFRHIAKLDINYSKWQHYEYLAEHSGPRYMHKEFCIICDRPTILKVNDKNQPHCDDGPYCEWRDGSALYSLNGVRVPMWVVEKPIDQISRADILKLKNTDERRELIHRIGNEKMIEILNPEIVDSKTIKLKSGQKLNYDLYMVDLEDDRKRPFLKMENPSMNNVIHVEGVHPDCKTVMEALDYRNETKELPNIIA